jgi:predicted translin family RNA/ssDNA-binding protein
LQDLSEDPRKMKLEAQQILKDLDSEADMAIFLIHNRQLAKTNQVYQQLF